MNKQTLILILTLLLVFIPTGVALKAYTADRFEIMNTEAGVAYVAAAVHLDALKIEKSKTPAKTTCTACKGTKKVLTGDGLHSMPCECGANCKCVASGSTPSKRLVLVTQPSSCRPCKLMDDHVIPALKANGWKFEKNGHVEVIDIDKNPNHGYNVDVGVPALILLEDEKETSRWTGFINGLGFGKVWNKQTVLQSDVVFIEYKAK